MPAYRFYTIGPTGHIEEPPPVVECADDATAIIEGRKRLDKNDIEIWQGKRVVSYLVPDSSGGGTEQFRANMRAVDRP